MTPTNEDRLLKTSEVATLASVQISTVRRWINERKLPATRTATGTLRIAYSDLRPFLNLKQPEASK